MDLFMGRYRSPNIDWHITSNMKRNIGDYQFQPLPNDPIPESELEVDDNENTFMPNQNFTSAAVGGFSPTYQQPNMSLVPANSYIPQQAYSYSQAPNYQGHHPPMKYLTNNRPNATAYLQYPLPIQLDLSFPDSSYRFEEAQGIPEPSSLNLQRYPDMTTLINSNASIKVPLVESAFVDYKTCSVCGKKISRDMLRHMRTHQSVARFKCNFPKNQCSHKSRRFNRPYDHKKHLLNRHFKFDIPGIKKLHNLNDKLGHNGTCPCGQRFMAKDWLEKHILTNNADHKCPLVE